MKLTQEEVKQVIEFIKKEPRTVQDVSKFLKKSWVTADIYLHEIKADTGLIDIKTFRKGTQGALKIAYYSNPDSLSEGQLQGALMQQILLGKRKYDFDFMELFQFIPVNKKKAFVKQYVKKDAITAQVMASYLKNVKNKVYIFSGNLSFIFSNNVLRDEVEELLKRKVHIKILLRVNIASLNNISKIMPLIEKYSEYLEIKHRYHPLRGIIVDEKVAIFRNDESKDFYKEQDLENSSMIFYEVFDEAWLEFLQKLFWGMFRTSIDVASRVKELKMIE